MSYLEEIEPYYERIKLQQSGGGGIRNREMMLEIANIHFKYIHSKDFKTITDIGCRVCVTRMMNQLVGLYNTEVKKQGDKMTFPKITKLIDADEFLVDFNKEDLKDLKDKFYPDPTKLSWGKFKTYCKGKGLSVKGKSKKELLKELGL